MAINDIYQIVLNYRWNDEIDCTNVFFYQQFLGNTLAAESLNGAFALGVTESILNVAPEFITFGLQQVVNVRNPVDFFEGDYGGNAGDRTEESDPMPSFLALQFKSTRAYPGTRSARKRFPFLYESDCEGNMITDAFRTSVVVTALADGLSDILTDSPNSFRPVVVAHPVALGTLPTVRYSLTEATWAAQARVSTQNTRKT